jgi:hypothetical protein
MISLPGYTRLLVRYPWVVLFVVAALTGLQFVGISRLRTDFNMRESSLPPGHPFVEIDRKIRTEFGGRNTVIVAIVPREGEVWRSDVLEIVRAVTVASLRLEDVIVPNVVSLAAPGVRYVEDREGRLDIDYLMRETPRRAAEIARLRARVESDPQLRGLLVTPDNRAALVMLDFWDHATHAELADRVRALAEPYRDAPVDFYFAGEPIMAIMNAEQMHDVGWRIPLTFLVIALMLFASFRNLQGMFIPMVTAALSTVWVLGLMGHTGIAIDGWNVATPILLIAIAAGHSAQMLKRYTEEVATRRDNHAAVVAATVAMGPVMVAAGSVATLGFASLAVIGIPAVTGFGLSCAYGIGSAVLLEMSFIPALRTVLPAPQRAAASGTLTAALLRALEWAIRERGGRWILIGTAGALAVAALGMVQIHTYGSTRKYMAPGSLPRVHLEKIEEHFPGTFTMTILYEGQPEDATRVELLRHMDGLRAELERDPLVWRTASLADLVKNLHRVLNSDAAVPYALPADQALTSQLLFLGSSPAFERFTDRAQSKAMLIAYLRDDDSARVGPLVRAAQAWVDAHPPPDGVRVLIAGGAGPTVLAVNEHTTHSKILNITAVVASIYLVSSLMMRSPLGGLYVITPIVVTLMLLFGLLGWTGIRLDMGSASMMAMAAGVGADYAIYFLYRLREERRRTGDDREGLSRALQTSGRAVIFVAASIAAGFSVMAVSKFFGMRLFGTLMPVAMAVSCLAALSIMPVLVLRTKPRFIFEDRAPALAAQPVRASP